jgi:UDP-GlcNAc3NAcA epimerase
LKILTVIGARPQFIKAAAVSRITQRTPGVEEVFVHTGQHYDDNLSEIFFREMGIPKPRHHLGIGSGTHGAQTGRMLEAVEQVLLKESPDWLLVYGDTNSTLAGALAAAKLHVPVAHVEAGLRSFNRQMPEEINRVVTDHVADLLFAPTRIATENLAHEGVAAEKIHWVGDVMYDAALHYGDLAKRTSTVLDTLNLTARGYVLATIHRAENTDSTELLTNIFYALAKLAESSKVVMPLHPRTRAALHTANIAPPVNRNFIMTNPVGYLDMVMLEQNAAMVVTDSGGVQKEAYFYKVPCATLRDETEWVELVESGWNTLVSPAHKQRLFERLLELSQKSSHPPEATDLYGSGAAAEQIVNILLNNAIPSSPGRAPTS